jgi:hypothetical protein
VASKCGPGACLRTQGARESDFCRARQRGKLRDEIHENAECVSEVVLGLVSVGTIKLDFMSIRETQQQQNFLGDV